MSMLVPADAIIVSSDTVTSHELTEGWSFRSNGSRSSDISSRIGNNSSGDSVDDNDAQGNNDDWLPAGNIPSNVHLDLRLNNRIPDPFLDLNELNVQWVAEQSWTYQCNFPAVVRQDQRVDLVFDGLDTFATVYLNGDRILESDNMFVQHRIDVTSKVRANEPNHLSIMFDSALLRAREIQKASPKHEWICWNGEPARLGVRKAQYHWGWDWGPKLVTCGIWKPVRLEVYRARIAHFTADVNLSDDISSADVALQVELEGPVDSTILFEVKYQDEFVAGQTVFVDATKPVRATFTIADPNLWWPVGYGKQPLYQVSATLGTDRHTVTKKIGLRRIELIQLPDKFGKSFYFEINKRPVFGAGCNWIPADSFTPRISHARYRSFLETAAEGRQCLIRCWGGGIWEPDVFYDLCDELGLLVWQDFLFACGNYPANQSLLDSIRAEGATQLRRLRDHACLALLAGNNEDYVVQESSGLMYDRKEKDPEKWLTTNFPARYIYEKLLPELVAEHAPHVIYHPGSPFSDGTGSVSDPAVGDIHQWNVWHGTQEKYQTYNRLGGRFVSEFGMEAMPVLETVSSFTSRKSELFPQSRTLDFHNKATGHERRLATYVLENFRMRTDDLASWIYLTQLAQSEAVTYAFSSWRRQWGRGRKVGGALYWQLNDCWPTTSWSLVDYYGRKKPAYYALKRAMAPLAVHVRRQHHDWSSAQDSPPERIAFDVWICSSLPESKAVMVELRFTSIRTGQDVQERISKSLDINPDTTTMVISASVENDVHDPIVISARLFAGSVVSRSVDWPQPLKYVNMSDKRGLDIKLDAGRLWISTKTPVKGVFLEEREGVKYSDNGFDVMPGDIRMVDVEGDDLQPPNWTYYEQNASAQAPAPLLGPLITAFTAQGASMKSITPILVGSPSSPPRPRRTGLSVSFQDPPTSP